MNALTVAFMVTDVLDHFVIDSTSSTISRGGASATLLYFYISDFPYIYLANLSMEHVQKNTELIVPCMITLYMFKCFVMRGSSQSASSYSLVTG